MFAHIARLTAFAPTRNATRTALHVTALLTALSRAPTGAAAARPSDTNGLATLAAIYISPHGADDALGTADAPLRTLVVARDKVRTITAEYRAAATQFRETEKAVYAERAKIAQHRLAIWKVFSSYEDKVEQTKDDPAAHGKATKDLEDLKEELAQVNRDNNAAGKRGEEAQSAFQAVAAKFAGVIHVKLMPGRYAFDQTLVIGMQDTGGDDLHIVYEAADPAAPPVICSDTPVTGWQRLDDVPHMSEKARGKLWVADIPQGLGRIYSLFDGDTRLPNSSVKFDTPSGIKGGAGGFRYDLVDTFVYPEGMMRDYENLSDIELAIYPRQRWMHGIMQFSSVDTGRCVAKTTRKLACGMSRYPGRPNASTLLNTIDYLDEPGEWCVNTRAGKVYYWPKEDRPSTSINAPALREFIRVEGDVDLQGMHDLPVRNVHFRDLVLTKGDRSVIEPKDGLAHSEWAIYDKDNAVLRFRGAENCTVDHVTIANTAGNGIRMDLHSQRITVTNSTIHNVGRSGVVVVGYGPGRKDVNGFNKVVNCTIFDVGTIHRMGHGVLMCQTHDSVVSHCKIYDTPFNAISMVGMRYWVNPYDGQNPEYLPVRWQDLPARAHDRVFLEGKTLDAVPQSEWAVWQPEKFTAEDVERMETDTDWFDYEDYVHTRNNRVEYCEMFNTSYDLEDSNAVYIHTSNEGNTVYYCYIHDLDNKNASTALRSDNVQRHAVFSHNIIRNVAAHGGINHSYDTVITNNYIINAREYIFAHQGPWPNTGLIERNICYATSGTPHLAMGIIPNKVRHAHERAKLKTMRPDGNLFFAKDYADADTAKLGKEAFSTIGPHSRYGDPKFMDLESFVLADDSPAHELGIDQIDVTRIGLLKVPYRVVFQ